MFIKRKAMLETEGRSGEDGRRSHVTYYYSCNYLGSGDHKWLYLLVLVAFSLNIESSLSSCPPLRIKYGKVQVQDSPYDGKYSNGSRALVSCEPGYYFKSGEFIYCLNGKWITSGKGREEPRCERNNGEDRRCDSPPAISHGYYHPPNDQSTGSSESDTFYVGTELQAACDPSFALNCPQQQACGKIMCTPEGTWKPIGPKLPWSKDGQHINCAAVPQTVVSGNSRDIRSDDDHGYNKSQSTQNYLILALALVCIVGVAALTIAILRRPLFCKKREQSQNDPHVIMTSSSPHHGGGYGGDFDNSIPVAMNTGIFVPGADYDLQDYHLQDGAMVGTQVFK